MKRSYRVPPADYKRLREQVEILQLHWNEDEDNPIEMHSFDVWLVGGVHIFAAYFFVEKSTTMQRYMVGFIPKTFIQSAMYTDSNASDLYYRFSKEEVVKKVSGYLAKTAADIAKDDVKHLTMAMGLDL